MKRIIALLLVLTLALSLFGCGQEPEPTTVPTTEATEPSTEPTTEPTTEPAPVYTNPLTGVVVEEPMDTRFFAVSINNLREAMPHYGVAEADIFMEMFVNGSIIRGLALYSDISQIYAMGPVRSDRLMFNDIVTHYDAALVHAGGDSRVLNDARNLGLDHFNIDTWDDCLYSFREKSRLNQRYTWDACLFGKGEGLVQHYAEQGMRTTQDPEKNWRLNFVEDATPDGEVADTITVTFTYRGSRKDSSMIYDADLGKYVYHQYGKMMTDGMTNAPEAFENVLIMFTQIGKNGPFHVADFVAGGDGYFACGGQIIPMKWYCDGDNEPFYFTTVDGEPLNFGVGNSYFAIAPVGSPFVYGALEAESEGQ